ncbi:hypothetical protein SDC9_127687 [bioreactor metagenome]|uniref:Uncharacterized protein n=1 Tax=bioreactor metagenome TaxID=1076179 RepID=A0A645CUN5_9ZZZZ
MKLSLSLMLISLMRLILGTTTTQSSGTLCAAHTAPGLPLSGVHINPALRISKIQASSESVIVRHSPSVPQEGRNPYFSASSPITLMASRAVLALCSARISSCSIVSIARASGRKVFSSSFCPIVVSPIATPCSFMKG